MIAIAGAFVELSAEDPNRLAGFYQRLVGLERVEPADGQTVLSGHGVTIRIRRGPSVEDAEGGPLFGFVLAPDLDMAAARSAAVEAGAIVLSESRRAAFTALSCSDPCGHEFLLVQVATLSQPAEGALVQVTTRFEPTVQTRQAASPPEPAPPPMALPRPISRRDVDVLRDRERLAQMQESIAGLNMGFTTDDPAAVMDDMRARMGSAADQAEKLARMEAAERARRQAEAEDILERYRRATGAPKPQSETHSPRLPSSESEDHSEVGPPRRTLGGTPGPDDTTG